MKLERITDISSSDYKALCKLYTESFPEVERRTIEQLDRLVTEKGNMHFNSIINDEGILAGLMVFWDFGSFLYLEHFAIFPEMRNGGAGKRTLELLASVSGKPKVLEAEPADDGIAGRRIEFYRRNGFEVIEKDYMQPSYRKDEEGTPLWVMATGSFDAGTTKDIISTIKNQVYYNNY